MKRIAWITLFLTFLATPAFAQVVRAGGVPLSAIEGKAAKGSPLNHSSTTVKRPVQERGS